MDDPGSEKAQKSRDWGTFCHYWKETGDTTPDWVDVKEQKCLAKKLAMSEIDRLEWWAPGDGEHETTFAIPAFDPKGMKLWVPMPKGTPWTVERDAIDAWKKSFDPKCFLTGSIDWFRRSGRGTYAWIDDLKTGHWPVDPKTSKQMRTYLLVAWIIDGMPLRWKGYVSITTWERYPLAGLPKRKFHELDGMDMLEHLSETQWALNSPKVTNPTEEHCRFCKSRGTCEAVNQEQDD